MNYYVTLYRTDAGEKAALVAEGNTKLHIVTMRDIGLTVEHASKTAARRFRPLTYKGGDYPMARACRTLKQHAKTHGATKAALDIIKHANGAKP